MSTKEKLLTTAEVAKKLRCGIPTVRRYIRERKFKDIVFFGKQFLISQDSVDAFLERHDPRNPESRIT